MTDAARILEFPTSEVGGAQRVTLLAILDDGLLRVRLGDGREWDCELLETGALSAPALTPGDRLLVFPAIGREPACVLGRIGRYQNPKPQGRLTIEATEVLTLRCGESSLNLRADGKLMIQGQDVLLKAKGTQRIKAGTVAIN